MSELFKFINNIKREYKEYPFQQKQLTRAFHSKPYRGLRILHNIPFTKATVVKLEILYAGGADVTVMSPSFMEVDSQLVDDFIQSGGQWIEDLSAVKDSFDFHLDCAGELLGFRPPKIGCVEITGTGTLKYQSADIDYPVISVDQSQIKLLEGVLGTGEAFVRAFKQLTSQIISNKNFMIFGFGKVGQGIAYYLSRETNSITIVENNPKRLEFASKQGYQVIAAKEVDKVHAAAASMLCVVTATGRANVISDQYDTQYFTGPFLANMGGEDEFGHQFNSDQIMCQKRPINFFVDQPTLMRYLDPVFYAHNLGIDILQYSNLSAGLHEFPTFLSDEIVTEWSLLFKEDLNGFI